MEDFTLHPQIIKDSIFIKDLGLSRLMLMNDARYPWVLLVPRIQSSREGGREIIDLLPGEQTMLLEEINQVSIFMKQYFGAQNLNIAALGNVVPVLHVHIIARFETDEAWPKPVWGVGQAQPYSSDAAQKIIEVWQRAVQ